MSDYFTISLPRDTVEALDRIRETRRGKVESYDHLIRRLAGLPERPIRTVREKYWPQPP